MRDGREAVNEMRALVFFAAMLAICFVAGYCIGGAGMAFAMVMIASPGLLIASLPILSGWV